MARASNPFSMVKGDDKRDPMAPFASVRAECADIARGKLRMARSDHKKYNPQSQRVVELLEDWAASFSASAA